ncbi:hypothetical protein [Actinotalea sp. K2]|uniref:hypothetical protein n=1 Tax=Actinotalea sp. K2 TaxID=2939438 RepID=UPI0020177BB4|nr:hypothetical protein [Actinotalea sp. K2]MCL3862729.1 hypothetical protein [Actinotalea sp. K2]
MTAIVYVVVALAVSTALGWAVLAPLPEERLRTLVPAFPLVGVAFLAAVSSWTSFVVAAAGSLMVAAVVAGVVAVVAIRRGARPWRIGRGPVRAAIGLLAGGAVVGAVALLPSLWAGDARPISPNPSHDVFYYVTQAEYLIDHDITPVPAFAPEGPSLDAMTPAEQPIRSSLTFPVRIGQPLVHAALSVASGTSPRDQAMAAMAVWISLMVPAGYVAGRLLGFGRCGGAAAGILTGSSALLVQQAYQQNADSLLGVCLGVLAVAVAAASLKERDLAWPAVVLLAGVVAVYTELLLFVAPAVAGVVLLQRWPQIRADILRMAGIVVGALVLAGPGAVRGVASLVLNDRSGDAIGSPLFSEGWWPAAARVVGATSLIAPAGASRTGVVLVVVAVAGLLLALLTAPWRRMWWPMLAVGGVYLAMATIGHHGYTQLRTAVLFTPFVTLAVVDGWRGLVDRLGVLAARRPRFRGVRTVLVVCLAMTVVVFPLVNLRAAPHGLDRAYALSRHVDDDFAEAASWISDLRGGDGEDVTVVVPDFFSQLWLSEALRDHRLTSYVSLWLDYLGTSRHWAGELDRFVLIGPGAVVDADEGTVVHRNDRFTLIDMSRGPVVVIAPTGMAAEWSHHASPGGGIAGADLATMTVLRSESASTTVYVEVAGLPPDAVVAVVPLGATAVPHLSDSAGGVPLMLTERVSTVIVDTGSDGVGGGPGFELEGVRGGG